MSTSLTDTQSLLPPQLRSEQGLLRALGRQILTQLPPVEYAFSYGSSAMPQLDPKTGQGESLESMLKSIDYHNGSKMFDIVLGVENISSWHDSNLNIMNNKKHYSFGGRYMRNVLGLSTMVQYHPQVPIIIQDKSLLEQGVPEVINVKYGVAPMDHILTDCIAWSSMYLAGRLHKPVTVLQDNPLMSIVRELNLHHAIVYSLLQLPPTFTELDLYTTIATISYKGDIRNKFGAEDPEKVKNLIRGSLPFFRELYGGILTTYLDGVGVKSNSNYFNNIIKEQDPTKKVPIYKYLSIPLMKTNNGSQHMHNSLPIFQNYHDVYNQITTLPPEDVIFSQPDTIQHRAMLLASLPANTYIHRSVGTNFVSNEHQEAQEKVDKDQQKKSKMAIMEQNNDGSDQAGLKAPGIHSRPGEDGENGQHGKKKLTQPLTYSQPKNDIEKEIPILPACLTAIPYSTFAFSFGPEVLSSIYATVSPYVKYDREVALISDEKKLKQILSQNTSKISQLLEQKRLKGSNNSHNSNNIGELKQIQHQSKQTFGTGVFAGLTAAVNGANGVEGVFFDDQFKLIKKQPPQKNPSLKTSSTKLSNTNGLLHSKSRGKFSTRNVENRNEKVEQKIETQGDDNQSYANDLNDSPRGPEMTPTDGSFIDLDLVHRDTNVLAGQNEINNDDLIKKQQNQQIEFEKNKKINQIIGKKNTIRKLQQNDSDDEGIDTTTQSIKSAPKPTPQHSSTSHNNTPDIDSNKSPSQPTPKPVAPPTSNTFLKHDITSLKRPTQDLTTPPPVNTKTHQHNAGIKANISTSTSNRLTINTNELYTTKISDILNIEKVLETPQQHTVNLITSRLMKQHLLLKKDQLQMDPKDPTSTLSAIENRSNLIPYIDSAIGGIDQPNVIGKTIVLPTVTPLPITASISNDTSITLLNVDTPNNTSVRAVELHLPQVVNENHNNDKNNKNNKNHKNNNNAANESKTPFIGWNKFSSHSNIHMLRSLPLVGADPLFHQEQMNIRQIQNQTQREGVLGRTQKRMALIDMNNEIKNLKTEVENQVKGGGKIEGTKKNDKDKNDDQNNNTNLITIEDKLARLDTLQTNVNKINIDLSDRNADNELIMKKLEKQLKPKLPGLWSALQDQSLVDKLSIITNKVQDSTILLSDLMTLTSLRPGSRSLKRGLMVQHPETQMIETNDFKNVDYFGQLFNIPNYAKQVKVIGAPNYSLQTIPQTDIDGKRGKDSHMLYASVGAPITTSANIDREKLQQDPWYYDRKSLPKFENETHSAMVELLGQVKAGALPEGGMNIYNDRRQRWQVGRGFDQGDIDEEVRRLGMELGDGDNRNENNNNNINNNNNDNQNINKNNQPSHLLDAFYSYTNGLKSKFINVQSAKYDSRRHMAGVARFDNSVNALQIIFGSKFPLFGANLLSSSLRQDMLPIWRHDLSARIVNDRNGDDIDHIQIKKQLANFTPFVHPLTSINSIKTYITDSEFLSALSSIDKVSNGINSTKITTIQQDNSIKNKNMEWVNSLYDWEKVLLGEYSTQDAKNPPLNTLRCIISNRTANIVERSSLRQTIAGFFSAGPVKSVKYVLRKLQKGKRGKGDKGGKGDKNDGKINETKQSIKSDSKRSFSTRVANKGKCNVKLMNNNRIRR